MPVRCQRKESLCATIVRATSQTLAPMPQSGKAINTQSEGK